MVRYFYRRRYRDSDVSIIDFYRAIEADLTRRGLAKVGYQMGYGLSFKSPQAEALGSVKARMRGGVLEASVATISPRAAKLLIRFMLVIAAPYLLVTARLGESGIVNTVTFLILVFGFAGLALLLGYEFGFGIFPSTRRLQKTLMQACNRVAEKAGASLLDDFTVVAEAVRTRKKELRLRNIWSPWPEMISEEDFLGETTARQSPVKEPVWWKATTPMKIAIASLIVVIAALVIAISYRILSGEGIDEILRRILS